MDMLGHENEGPDIKIKLFARRFDGFGKPQAHPFGRQKLETTEAGERQFMSVTRLIEIATMEPNCRHSIPSVASH